MKNVMYLASLVLVLSVFVGLTGCDDPEIQKLQKTYLPTESDHVEKAMELVQEYKQIFADRGRSSYNRLESGSGGFFQDVDDIRAISEAYSTYAQNIQTIDISKCPVDFQARFKNYVQCEAKMASVFASVTSGNIFAMSEGDRAKENVDAAWEALTSLAVEKYGMRYQ